jgi:hypothetical protein
MKPALVPFALATVALTFAAASCRCGGDTPTPVTIRVKNTLPDGIWVDQSKGQLGVELQRSSVGSWVPFTETLACACLSCGEVCDCNCDAGSPPPRVMKVAGNGAAEREWEGEVQQDGTATCGSLFGGKACFRASIPSLDETMRARLCYALGPPVGTGDPGDAGIPVPGRLDPGALLCVTADFRPQDGVVELSPQVGSGCQSHGQCNMDAGELCFGGACTTGCPATGFPEYGNGWFVAASLSDQGFFTVSTVGSATVSEGTGTLTAVTVNNGTMVLSLSRPEAGGGNLLGSIYLSVPPAYFPVMFRNETVSVKVVDASTGQLRNNRALTIRDAAGKLIIAMDPGLPAPILGASDTSPFTVAGSSDIVGCDQQTCGKRLHFRTGFGGAAADAGTALLLDPGATSTVVAGGLTYKLLNVADNRPASLCSSTPQVASLAVAQR